MTIILMMMTIARQQTLSESRAVWSTLPPLTLLTHTKEHHNDHNDEDGGDDDDGHHNDYPIHCLPQNCLLVGNPEVGNSDTINHQDCLP